MEGPYTQRRAAQFRGPSTSDDYNKRIEENYNDLVVLFNRARISEVELDELYRRMAKDHLSFARVVSELEERIDTLESNKQRFTFHDNYSVDTDRFNDDTEFAVPQEDRLTVDSQHGLVLLPRVETSSMSKLFFTNTDGQEVVPPSLEMRVVGEPGTADNLDAYVESSDPEFALYRKPGLIWERNVVVTSANANGAELTLYVKVPTDLFTTAKSNAVVIHPFPYFGSTIKDISYTLNASPMLRESDGYTTFNQAGHYIGESQAQGWVVPGGWGGSHEGDDEARNTGPRAYHFPAQPITALRIKLHQADYHREADSFIYSYGLSHLDLRYDKFLPSGTSIIRFDAREGQTINSIDDVQPQMWNVSPANLSRMFSWRAIWETSYNSGIYTTSPVANSNRVWIEVTLENPDGGWSPALSGLEVYYNGQTFIDGGDATASPLDVIDGGSA